MAQTDVRPMHEGFSRWYGAVCLGDDRERLDARWEAVSEIARKADRSTAEGLLRLALQSRHVPAADVVGAIRQAFKTTDDTFEMSGNDREFQVLAGTCLAVMMDTGEGVGEVAALIATTSGFGGARHPDLPMDLVALGETAIARIGNANRSRPSLEANWKAPRMLDLEDATTKVSDEQSFERVADAFKLFATNVTQLANRQARVIHAIDDFLRVQDEELQMLWWLTNQRSWQLDCSFDAIPPDARPLVLADELARHTEFLPGPPSVKGILSRAGLKEHESVRIVDAVKAADFDWLQGLVADVDPSFVSTPLHAAIKRQLETGPGEAWVAGWAASTGVNDDYTCSALALGNLFYRERLLLLFQ